MSCFFLYNHLSPDYKRKLPQLNILILRDLVSLKLKTTQSICTRIKLRGANYNLAICFHNRGSLRSSRGEVSIYVNNRDLPRHVQFKKKNISGNKAPYESFCSWYRQFSQTLSMLLDRVFLFTQLQKFDLCWMQTYSCKLLIWVVFSCTIIFPPITKGNYHSWIF